MPEQNDEMVRYLVKAIQTMTLTPQQAGIISDAMWDAMIRHVEQIAHHSQVVGMVAADGAFMFRRQPHEWETFDGFQRAQAAQTLVLALAAEVHDLSQIRQTPRGAVRSQDLEVLTMHPLTSDRNPARGLPTPQLDKVARWLADAARKVRA